MINGTPFTAVYNDEAQKWAVVCGRNLASNKMFETYEEAKKFAEEPNWETIGSLIFTIINLKK